MIRVPYFKKNSYRDFPKMIEVAVPENNQKETDATSALFPQPLDRPTIVWLCQMNVSLFLVDIHDFLAKSRVGGGGGGSPGLRRFYSLWYRRQQKENRHKTEGQMGEKGRGGEGLGEE